MTIDGVRVANNGLNGINVSDGGGSLTNNSFVIRNTEADRNTALLPAETEVLSGI